MLIFRFCTVVFIALHVTALHAETALEAITRESKNKRVDPRNANTSSQKTLAKAVESVRRIAPSIDAQIVDAAQQKPSMVQRIDEIIVEAQREPEDVKPPEVSPFQKMKTLLDGVGKSALSSKVETQTNGGARSTIVKINGGCFVVQSNPGRMNNDGSLGSAARDAISCTNADKAAR